jgi:hypothetical protein
MVHLRGRISLFCNFSLTPGFSPVGSVTPAKAVSTAWPVSGAIRQQKRLKPFFSAARRHPTEVGC